MRAPILERTFFSRKCVFVRQHISSTEISTKKRNFSATKCNEKMCATRFSVFPHEEESFLVSWDHRLSLIHFVSRKKKKKIKKSCPLLLPPRKRARLPPGVHVWPPPGGRSLPPITGAFLIVWMIRRVGFVLCSFSIFGRERSEVWYISNNHSVMDCPCGIFFYPRARLKGFVVHLLKEQQRRRENARSLFSRSNRSEVLLLLLFSSLVKSLLLLISHFFPKTHKL